MYVARFVFVRLNGPPPFWISLYSLFGNLKKIQRYYTLMYVYFDILDETKDKRFEPSVKVNSLSTSASEPKVKSKRCAGKYNHF